VKRIFRLSGRDGDVERDVADEIRFHLEMRTRELIAGGMSRDDARAEAERAFGDRNAIAASSQGVRAGRDRDRSRRDHLQGLGQDVRFAWRTLWKNPGFAVSALLTLALGIGATTAVFTVLNGVLLRPLPYANHERLVSIWTTAVIGGEAQDELPFSAANFADLRAKVRSGTVEEVAAFRAAGFVLGAQGEPELIPGALVTGGFFATLGTTPVVGRAIVEADAEPGAPRVTVIGHDLWKRRLGGDPSIIGTSVALNGTQHVIVGVMPPAFLFPRGTELPSGFQFPARTEIWAAYELTAENLAARGTFNLAVIGLLKPGSGPAGAEREITAAMRAIGDANGMASISLGGNVVQMQDQSVASVRSGLLLLFGAVALVLLIACANVSNLLLAHTAGRQREMAIRTAIGAGRWRIVRQLVTENLLLAVAGGVLGIALAVWGKEWLLTLVPASLPRLADIAIDVRVLATALAVALGAGIVFGIVAAVHATRSSPAAALRSGTRTTGGTGHARFRHGLVIAEVALSLVLLAGAAALVHSFTRIQRVAPGFDPRGVLTSQVLLPSTRGLSFREEAPRWAGVFTQYLDRVRSIPGVEAAGAVSSLPLSGAWESSSYSVDGKPAQPNGARPEAHYAVASPDYFRAMSIPLREGRSFASSDVAASSPVIVVSRSLAEQSWPGESAVGKRILLFSDQPLTIVGVVEDLRQTSLIAPAEPTIYLPLAQSGYPVMSIVVKTIGDPLALVPSMRRELGVVDPLLPLEEIRTMAAVLDASLAQRRFGMLLLGFFAASALALVVIGLYGVIAYGVAQRTHEIGVRMALGASRRDVFRLVVGEGARVTAIGVGLGLAGAVGLSRVLASMLYGVSALNPFTLGAVTLLLVVIALFASGMPARRAMRVEPVEALRGE